MPSTEQIDINDLCKSDVITDETLSFQLVWNPS